MRALVCVCARGRTRLARIYCEVKAKVADKNSLKKSLFLERFRVLRAIFFWKWHFVVHLSLYLPYTHTTRRCS